MAILDTWKVAESLLPIPLGFVFIKEDDEYKLQIRNLETDTCVEKIIVNSEHLNIDFINSKGFDSPFRPEDSSNVSNWKDKLNCSNSWLCIPPYEATGKEYVSVALNFQSKDKENLTLFDLRTGKQIDIYFKYEDNQWKYKIHFSRRKYHEAITL